MKQFMIVLLALLITADINSCNLCWGYPKGNRLRQIPIQKMNDCACECWKYPKTKGDNNYYICVQCLHRLMPEEVISSKTEKSRGYKSKRFAQRSKKHTTGQ